MADLDKLQIQIESNVTPAANAIDKLIHSFERLNQQISQLDVSRINRFSNAINKITNTNAAAKEAEKGIGNLSKTINKAFGINTAEGIKSVKNAVTDLYEASKAFSSSGGDIQIGNNLDTAKKNLTDVIKNFYKLKVQSDETSESVRNWVEGTKKGGFKINTSDMAKEFGEDYKTMLNSIGNLRSVFSTKSGSDFEQYINEMKSVLGENLFSDKPDQAFKQLIDYLSGAKDEVLKFNDAVDKGVISENDVKNSVSETLEGVEQLQKRVESISNVPRLEDVANAFSKFGLVPSEKMKAMEDAVKQVSSNAEQVPEAFNEIGQAASVAAQNVAGLEDATEGVADVSKTVADTTTDIIKDASSEVEDAVKKGTKEGGHLEVLAGLMAIGHELKELSEQFERLAEVSKKALKAMVKPLELASEEYIESLEKIKQGFEGFKNHVQKSLTKIAAFWKRIMRTFTFMLVRKAITAIIKEVNNAIQSMAMFSDAMGTKFNSAISSLVADFQYLGRSIVSVFAPLINFIAPIIDAIVDKIALLLSYIGMLMAALTGASSFTKAKKNVGNYAKSLDSASKSAKNLTMGIDELNILSENSGGGSSSPFDGWEDAWEEVPIPDWINDLAKKIKDIFKDLFEPIKKAWDKAKAYVLSGWNYMCREMSLLLQSIWRDFIRVWKSDTVVDIFYKLFLILGDIEYTIGNLARNFRLAWDEAEKGYNILKNIAEIIDILVNHVRNVTLYMTTWSDQLDFNPLLESIVHLTEAMKGLADFLGGVFEDVMKNVVLKYITFLTEEGIPHLLHTITEFINSLNFDKIRDDLKIVEDAFERLLENLDVGKTNALGNLGEQISGFLNSQEFTDFMQRLADIMDMISAEDVEKLLTGIGEGILRIAEGIVKFVNSDAFMDFLTAIDEWLSNASSEDIADIFEGLAIAIALFDFSAFAMEKIAGFLQFMAIIEGAQKLAEIAGGMSGVAAGTEAVGASAAGLGPVALIIAAIVLAVGTLVESFGGLKGLLSEIGKRFDEVKKKMSGLAEKFKISEKIDALSKSFSDLKAALGTFKDFWMLVFDVIQAKVEAVLGGTMGFISGLIVALQGAVEYITGLVEVLSGVIDIIIGIFSLDPDKILEGFGKIGDGIKDIFSGIVTFIDGIFTEIINTIDGFFASFGIDIKLSEMYESIKTWAEEKKNAILEFFANFDLSAAIESILQWFRELPNKIAFEIGKAIGKFAKWAVNIGHWAVTNVPLIVDDIIKWFKDLPGKLLEKLLETIESFAKWKADTSEWFTNNLPSIISKFISYFEEIPQKLWDLGTDIVSGLIGGVQDAWDKLKTGVSTFCDNFVQGVKDGFGISSPSKEAAAIGDFFLQGLILPMQEDTSWMDASIIAFCEMLIEKFRTFLSSETFSEIGQQIITGIQAGLELSNADTMILSFAQRLVLLLQNTLNPDKFMIVGQSIIKSMADGMLASANVFSTVMERIGTTILNTVTDFMNTLGTLIQSSLLPTFIETYIVPFFSIEMWEPYLIMLLEGVLMPAFENFTIWFEESMMMWWEEGLLKWFDADKWNEDIFRPLKECIQEHWDTFSSWWDATMLAWWNNQVLPWFEKSKWKEQFNNILEVAKEVFREIKEAIQEQITEAKQSVEDACEAMKESLQSVLEVIGAIMSEIASLSSIGGSLNISLDGFAAGGYPTAGSLFLANEAGAELIGTIGGKTAVASNDEITGIRDAVYETGSAESELLAQLIGIARAVLDKDPVIIGDKDIARMANNGQNQLGMSIIR